jgi:hypothetical protein
MTGRMTPPGQQAAPASITLEMKRPRSSRFEFTAQGVRGVQAYDGRQAWGIPPGPGARPEPLPDEMAKDLVNQADIDGPLVDYKKKGHKVELVGRDMFGGTDAWKLLLRFKSGDVMQVFLDAKTHLEIGSEARRVVRGNELEAETRFSDYREAGGVLWPHTIETGPKGRSERQVVRFEKVEVNPPIDDARFTMPRR